MNKILDKLEINEYFTKPVKKPKTFDKVKENIPHEADYNFMADLLFLPTTSKGYKYLLVVVDLWTDEFDIEPLKSKDPKEVLAAMKRMFKRPYLNKPYASIATDAGSEFKGVFHKYLYDESIFHKQTKPGRHTQMSNVESLNRSLGRLFNGYMNKKEETTGKQYHDWDDIITFVRKELNEYRVEQHKKHEKSFAYKVTPLPIKTKFKVGDIVYYQSDVPLNALGKKQSTERFREGDYRWNIKEPRKIVDIFAYNNGYRYSLEGMKNVSFTEKQLRPAKETDSKYEVKQILDKKKMKGKIHYLIWFKGYKKKDAEWLPRTQLIEDGLKNLLDEFDGV